MARGTGPLYRVSDRNSTTTAWPDRSSAAVTARMGNPQPGGKSGQGMEEDRLPWPYIDDITIEWLGDEYTGEDADAIVAQFKRACEAAIEQHPGIWNFDEDGVLEEKGVIDYVWNDGDFQPMIRELLGEELGAWASTPIPSTPDSTGC